MNNAKSTVKDQLISELWLPSSKILGEAKAPRLKKNKNFKFFTLTTGLDYNDIICLIKSNISKFDKITAWTSSSNNKIRVETSLKVKVYNQENYEDADLNSHDIRNLFPFDIINLDYVSQGNWDSSDKLRKVVCNCQETIKLQKAKNSDMFLLILTIPLEDEPIQKDVFLDLMHGGSSFTSYFDFPDTIVDKNNKASFLEEILTQLFLKNMYVIFKTERKLIEQPMSVFSISIIAEVMRN